MRSNSPRQVMQYGVEKSRGRANRYCEPCVDFMSGSGKLESSEWGYMGHTRHLRGRVPVSAWSWVMIL